MAKIFLTYPAEARRIYYGDEALARLREAGEVVLNDSDETLPLERVVEAARDCEIIVSDRTTPGPAELFDRLPDLVAFVRGAVDIRNVDVEAASRHGVLVTRASAGFVDSVTELGIGFMIDLARGITAAAEAYHAGRVPEVGMGRQLSASTLGVIGYGRLGRRLAEVGKALGMRVLVSDPHATVDDPALTRLDLTELLRQSDFVVCLAVATEATENLIDAEALAAMRPSAYFINLSRGNLVDEAALAQALRENRIAGAAMDVGRAHDQMPSPELAALPNVVATPHIGGLTPEAAFHQSLETAVQVAEIVRGRAPNGAVNADRASRLSRLATGGG